MIIDLLGSPRLDQYDLSSLQYVGGGGAAMPQAVAQRLEQQFGLRYIEGYGLDRGAPRTRDTPKRQCLGIPFIGTDARVVDPDTLWSRDGPGEIVVHGPQVFKGYWRRPADTEAAFFDLDGKHFPGPATWGTSTGRLLLPDRPPEADSTSVQGLAGAGRDHAVRHPAGWKPASSARATPTAARR